MALGTPTALLTATSDTTPADPQDTASVTPTANTPGFIAVVCTRNPATSVTVTAGSGLDLGTITEVDHYDFGTIASPSRSLYVFKYTGAASPGSGVITIDPGAAPNGLAWGAVEIANMDTTNLVTAKNRTDSAAGLTVTLDDAGGTLSWGLTLGFFANNDSTSAMSLGAGFTGMWNVAMASSNSSRFRGEYVASKDLTVDAGATTVAYAGIAVGVSEVAAPAGQPSSKRVGGVPGMNLRPNLLGPRLW